MYKDINKSKAFENAKLGFEFEFFSPMPRKMLAERLSALLNKKVVKTGTYHSTIPVDENQFKLEPDYSGGFKMHELVTGPLPYHEAIQVFFKVMNFIQENGFTNDKSGLHINVSINEFDAGLKNRMESLNVFKFILNLNEEKIFELWPNATSKVQKIYKNSVSFIYPKNKFLGEAALNYSHGANPMDFVYPATKYFGVNFTKLAKGYLEVRYAGGQGYEKKKNESIELINIIIENIYNTLSNNNTYSDIERHRINRVIAEQKKRIESMRSYENFKLSYPDISLYVDTISEHQKITAMFPAFRDKLFDLVMYGNLKKGVVNYDSDLKKLQIKGAKIENGFLLEGFQFFECYVEGELKECLLYGCKVRSSMIKECEILNGNDIRYSYVDDCLFNGEGMNEIRMSFIKNKPGKMIFANLSECIVRRGTLSENSTIDSKTELIEIKKLKQKRSQNRPS